MTILWAINDRNGAAVPLDDKEVRLYYTCERGRFEAKIQIQDGNIVVWKFAGKEQRALGGYTLSVNISQQGKRSIRKDICNAFFLVSRGCEESYDDGEGYIKGNELTLTSELDIYRISPIVPEIGPNGNWWIEGEDTGDPSMGTTAFLYAKSKGFVGTEDEFAELQAATPSLSKKLDEVYDYLKKGEAYVYGETLTFRNYIGATVEENTLKL